MQIKRITNSKQWLDAIYRGARAKRMDEQQLSKSFVLLLLRTQYMHTWLYYLPIRGRKNKGNRLHKLAADYFYSLSGPDRIKLVNDCFEINWGSRSLKTIYQSMLTDDDLIKY
ncbi:hypothetical protein BCY75_05760 [Latilactobacillus curvatus]|uniref:hypothetical protein n=1 Tax=Latilactobacillus curvatus TaxID=28038 RepID=UPI0008152957|nr:hypothetical protein [Latilactobacillus curvatus]ANY13516.1 hypothetical protein BCY75_05760 [Latilactobacillus curvatus]AOO75182.1 hypothetical protein LCW_03465 [Latilactobacillus curvatus]